MLSVPARRALLATAVFALTALGARAARADDCPPGSVFRSQDGFSWCEPTVCQTDGQCKPDEVCRPLGLCMQVGSLATGASLGDAGKRLVVTQQCAPDKTCPQTTVCSDLGRCLAKNAAARMGLLGGATDIPPEKKKSSCGCRAVGGAGASPGAGLLFVVAGALLSRRARAGSRARGPRAK